jgi:hypothetical protein
MNVIWGENTGYKRGKMRKKKEGRGRKRENEK